MGLREEERSRKLCEGIGEQNSLPEIPEDEELILVMLHFLAGPVIVQGLLVLN